MLFSRKEWKFCLEVDRLMGVLIYLMRVESVEKFCLGQASKAREEEEPLRIGMENWRAGERY